MDDSESRRIKLAPSCNCSVRIDLARTEKTYGVRKSAVRKGRVGSNPTLGTTGIAWFAATSWHFSESIMPCR